MVNIDFFGILYVLIYNFHEFVIKEMLNDNYSFSNYNVYKKAERESMKLFSARTEQREVWGFPSVFMERGMSIRKI